MDNINYENQKDQKNRKALKYLSIYINLFVLIILIFFSIYTYENIEYINTWSKIISTIIVLMFVLHSLQFYFMKLKYYDFRIWFIYLFYLFIFGRVILHGFNLDSDIFWDLMPRFSNNLLYETSLYSICFLQATFIGLIFFPNTNRKIKKESKLFKEKSSLEVNQLVYRMGIFIVLFSLPFKLFIDIGSVILAQGSGSYANFAPIGPFIDISYLFVPGVIAMISGAKKNNKIIDILILIIILYFVIIMILTGDRRYSVTGIISMILAYSLTRNIQITFVRTVFLGVGGLIFFNFLAIVRKIRQQDLTSLLGFISEHGKELFSFNVIYETVSEFGITFFSVVQVIQNVPSEVEYLYGLTFIGSIPSLLPSGFLLEDFYRNISISKLVSEHSTGASITGDFFANFGWFGILGALLMGIILSRIFYIKTGKNKSYYIAKYYSLFYILINLVRSSYFEIFRISFLVYLFPLLIMYLINSRSKAKRSNEIRNYIN